MTKESSKSISTPSSKASSKEGPNPKPIKLRAACNNCFSAKVRCDGNKEGCRRCCDKRLSCVYSESRVGKVVGKRRKRPIEGALGVFDSENWIVNQSPAFYAIPSPPASQYSEPTSKRQCSTNSSNSWTSFLVEEHQDLVDFEETAEPLTFDMIKEKTFCESTDMPFLHSHGLPTPGMSPPQYRYLSPAALEARPMSRSTSVATDASRLLPPRFSTALSLRSSATPEPEDNETVCIRLLSHLKKHSSGRALGAERDLDLLKKTNASVRRILQNKSVRVDYVCQLLLSSIVTHMVGLCEQICQQSTGEQRTHSDSNFTQDQMLLDTRSDHYGGMGQPQSLKRSFEATRLQVVEATNIATEVADLLKRKPLDGFQVLGRHESHHIELDLRLQRALAKL